jgi:hypothetical protein
MAGLDNPTIRPQMSSRIQPGAVQEEGPRKMDLDNDLHQSQFTSGESDALERYKERHRGRIRLLQMNTFVSDIRLLIGSRTS